MKHRRPISDESLEALVAEIHTKLDGVVFNGGFETLVAEMRGLKQTQQEMLTKVEELHKVVYEPDDGLFARVKRMESTHREELVPIRQELAELSKWKEDMNAKDGPVAVGAQDHARVEELMTWKKQIFKFILGAASATLLTTIKLVWDFLRDHVSLR